MKKVGIVLSIVVTLFLYGCNTLSEPQLDVGEKIYAGYFHYPEIENGLIYFVLTEDETTVLQAKCSIKNTAFSSKISSNGKSCSVVRPGLYTYDLSQSALIDENGNATLYFGISKKTVLELNFENQQVTGTLEYMYSFKAVDGSKSWIPFGNTDIVLEQVETLPEF